MFWKNFIFLCNQKGMAPNAVCADIGLSSAVATKWKNGAIPRSTTLKKIADYFGVSVEYLLGKEDPRPEEPTQDLTAIDHGKIHMIPLYETVSAGFGAMARDEVVDYMPICLGNATEAARTICIRVRGDSMSPTIDDGDIVQVRKQDTVDSGSIAVVLVDGDEGLVKRVEYGKGWVELQSLNPTYKPLRRNGAAAEGVRIVGLVTNIIKDVRNRRIGYTPTAEEYDDARAKLFNSIDQMDEDQIKMLDDYVEFLKARRKI